MTSSSGALTQRGADTMMDEMFYKEAVVCMKMEHEDKTG